MTMGEIEERVWLRLAIPFALVGALVCFLIVGGWAVKMLPAAFVGAMLAGLPALVIAELRTDELGNVPSS